MEAGRPATGRHRHRSSTNRREAGFAASPQLGPAPLRVRFTDASHDPDGDPVSRHWSFGDGATRSGGLSPTHTFRDPGDYTVTLRVFDPDGEHDSSSKVIHVGSVEDHDRPNVKITDAPRNPSDSRNAHFSFTSDEQGRGFECRLDGESEPCGGSGAGANTAPVSRIDQLLEPVEGAARLLGLDDRRFRQHRQGVVRLDDRSRRRRRGGFDHIVISPANATIQPGDSQAYSAEAFDTNGDSMGNVTADTTFSIAPDGSCNGHTCSAKQIRSAHGDRDLLRRQRQRDPHGRGGVAAAADVPELCALVPLASADEPASRAPIQRADHGRCP